MYKALGFEVWGLGAWGFGVGDWPVDFLRLGIMLQHLSRFILVHCICTHMNPLCTQSFQKMLRPSIVEDMLFLSNLEN